MSGSYYLGPGNQIMRGPDQNVVQYQAVQVQMRTVIRTDGSSATEYAYAAQWSTSDSRYLPPAASLPLFAPLSSLSPAVLALPHTHAHQLPWGRDGHAPAKLALPAPRGFLRRLLLGNG